MVTSNVIIAKSFFIPSDKAQPITHRECSHNHGQIFQNFAFVINSTPKVKPLTVDFDENIIQMPLPVRVTPYPLFADFINKFCTKSVCPESYCFMANIDFALM